MSKGSENRTTKRDQFRSNYDFWFRNMKKKEKMKSTGSQTSSSASAGTTTQKSGPSQ